MNRNYPYSETELLKLASKFKAGIEKYSEKLEGELPDFEPNFRDNYNKVYSDARNTKDDNSIKEQISELQKSIEAEVNLAVDLFKSFRLYVQRAFPHDYRIWDKFSYRYFENASHDYKKMLSFFNDFQEIVQERKRYLDSVHCPDELYSGIDTNRDLLHNMVDKNEKLLDELIGFNEMRLAKFNELFYLMGVVRDTVENIFVDEPETIKMFALPVPKGVKVDELRM
jgi:hypothetical protein